MQHRNKIMSVSARRLFLPLVAGFLILFGWHAAPAHAACGKDQPVWPSSGNLTVTKGSQTKTSMRMDFALTSDEICSLQQNGDYLEIDLQLAGVQTADNWDNYQTSSNIPGAVKDVSFGDSANEPSPGISVIKVSDLVANQPYYFTISWDEPLLYSNQTMVVRFMPSHWAGYFDGQESVSCAIYRSDPTASPAWCIFPNVGSGPYKLFGPNGYDGDTYTNGQIPLSSNLTFSWKKTLFSSKPVITNNSLGYYVNANFIYQKVVGTDGTIALDASPSFSTDPKTGIVMLEWYKDGVYFGLGQYQTVTMSANSTASVKLIATDLAGRSSSITKTVGTANRAPVMNSYTPANGATTATRTPSLTGYASDDDGNTMQYYFRVYGNGVDSNSGWISANSWAIPKGLLTASATYSWTVQARDSYGALSSTMTISFTTPANIAPSISSLSPKDSATVGTNTPTLSASASDPEGDSIQYYFRIYGPNADINSGWISANSWKVPASRLDPGTKYSWSVQVRDNLGAASATKTQTVLIAMLPIASGMITTASGNGYWQVASDGGVFSYGDAQFYGSVPGLGIRLTNIMGIARTPSGNGYWIVGSDGGVFSFGDAGFYGSIPGLNIHINNIVGMAPTKDGRGYWLVGSDGGVFSFGDAAYYGSMGGQRLNGAIEAIAPTSSSRGYWLVGRDGGIFAFGDAPFYGSLGGQRLNAAIIDIDTTPDGGGYWLTGEDGGVFTFGNAGFYGSMGGKPLSGRITSLSPTADGKGYWLTGCDGGVFSFGNAQFFGAQPRYACRGSF